MAIHGICNVDDVKASLLKVISGRYEESDVAADVDNGRICALGALVSGERELHKATPVATATADRVYLIRTPEVMYRVDQTGLENFYNEAGREIRLYPLEADDVFKTTYNNVTGTPAVGKYVISADGSNKLTVADDLTGGTKFAGKIIALETLGYNKQNAIVVQVIKN